jgi:transcriptional regulator with XRE-family HTH domain
MDQVTRTPKQLGRILRRRRKEVGLSQEALASRIHLRQATISAWRILQLIPDWTRCSML